MNKISLSRYMGKSWTYCLAIVLKRDDDNSDIDPIVARFDFMGDKKVAMNAMPAWRDRGKERYRKFEIGANQYGAVRELPETFETKQIIIFSAAGMYKRVQYRLGNITDGPNGIITAEDSKKVEGFIRDPINGLIGYETFIPEFIAHNEEINPCRHPSRYLNRAQIVSECLQILAR